MIASRMVRSLAVAGNLALGAAALFAQSPASTPARSDAEPSETRVVMLPGPRPAAPEQERKPAPPAPPKRENAAPPEPSRPGPPPSATGHSYPADLDRDSAAFCQKQIGRWTEEDARETLGSPTAERPAMGDEGADTGRILAFADPTGRHMELELDFDGQTGVLRTVFVYPWYMSWADCRRRWGINVSAARANKGRMFYSYLDRRLDVLVDSDGRVVSLGLY